jgi:hypothetical protein
MKEIWKTVVGYEGYYEISDLGNVRSLERVIEYELKTQSGTVIKRVVKKSKLLKVHIANTGYYTTDLQVNGIRQTVAIHRLIAEAFIPNPENKATVNHKDGVKTNIAISNLEWATFSENNKHAVNNGLRESPWTGIFGSKHPQSKPVVQLDKTGNVLNRFANAREAQVKTGASYKHISSCCLGKRISTGGYCWKFDNVL